MKISASLCSDTHRLFRPKYSSSSGCPQALLLGAALSAWGSAAAVQAAPLLEEVMVTARKVEENLQDTPVAVSAFTSEAMERRMLVTTEDLSRVTPNLQFKSHAPLSGNSSAAQVFIRGIGQSDASGGVDPGVGLYIDDVYMGRSVGGVMDFRDIANVQVLRGPQGTLFGRNTIGGAVLLTTKKPGSEFGGKVKLGVGDEGLLEFFGALDLPFSDTVAARVSYGTRERDGYVDRIYDGVDLGNEDSYTINGSLHWDPSETVNIILRADYTEEDENGSPFVFAAINENAAFPAAASVDAGCPGATFPPPSVPIGVVDQRCANNATWDLGEYTNGGNTKAESNLENKGVSLTANWDVNDLLSLKYIFADRDLEWDGSRDADNTFLTILSTQYNSSAEQQSHELQLLAQGNSFSGVVGAFYFEEDVNDLLLVPFGNPGFLLPPGRAVGMDYQDAQLENENVALFTQWSFDITEALSFSAGLRYTEEEKTARIIAFTDVNPLLLTDDGSGVFLPPDNLPTPAIPTTVKTAAGDLSPGQLNVSPNPETENFYSTTGSLSLQYRLNDRLMAYISWSQGFKSGGFNQRYNVSPPIPDGSSVPVAISFDEEKAESWELGFKADVTDSLRVNGALFSTDYQDMQLTYRVGIVPILFNAGESTIEGAELEFTYAPSAAFILEGSLGYLDDSIDSVDDIPGTTATLGPDSDLPFTPEISASLGAAYTVDLNNWQLTPRLDIAYTGQQYFDAANTEEVAQSEGETVLNFSLRLADMADVWNIVAGVENLTDETYAIAGNSSLSTGSGYAEVIYSRPRNYYLTATYNF